MAAGEFAPGETIPSGRDLAEQWDVSRATAIKDVDVLRNGGVVVAKQGTGFVVTETLLARPAGARRAGSAWRTALGEAGRLGVAAAINRYASLFGT